MKFGIGQPMRRHEDLRLVTGRGRYTDDVILPRMTHAFVLRSPVAHAHIKRIQSLRTISESLSSWKGDPAAPRVSA
jgi:carbon-monoxide dehydrogenase large subunit